MVVFISMFSQVKASQVGLNGTLGAFSHSMLTACIKSVDDEGMMEEKGILQMKKS
jgi:hypothetical protein